MSYFKFQCSLYRLIWPSSRLCPLSSSIEYQSRLRWSMICWVLDNNRVLHDCIIAWREEVWGFRRWVDSSNSLSIRSIRPALLLAAPLFASPIPWVLIASMVSASVCKIIRWFLDYQITMASRHWLRLRRVVEYQITMASRYRSRLRKFVEYQITIASPIIPWVSSGSDQCFCSHDYCWVSDIKCQSCLQQFLEYRVLIASPVIPWVSNIDCVAKVGASIVIGC